LKFLTLLLLISSNSLWAGNPDTIRACSNINYTKNHDLNVCIKSGADADIVTACAKTGIRDMQILNNCITSGASREKISSCSINLNNFNNCISS
jgi:hypothetical protein